MTRTINVDLGERSYAIHVGAGLTVGGALGGAAPSILLVSDSNVAPLYSGECAGQLKRLGARVVDALVPAGEQSKSLACAQSLYDQALDAGLDRQSVVVALGGGMVGDLAGFVAATFLRGLRLIQVPTSLLAMVDSSVGGKTAVNLPRGKNLVGVFHQPLEVIADLNSLATLPEREYRSGLAEVVKYGVIWDAGFFERLEQVADHLLRRDAGTLQDVVARCCEIKAETVALDERESGVRAFLNFGHTCGHALEQVSGYGRWLHGEAVALGMVYAMQLSVAARGCAPRDAERVTRLLDRLRLPVRPDPSSQAPAWRALREAMSSDKKNRGRTPRFVLANTLGKVTSGCEVGEDTLVTTWNRMLAS